MASVLVVAAVVGQLWPLATAWLLPVVSEFTVLGDNVSELALGRYGVLQDVAFVVAGIGALAAAVLIRSATLGSGGLCWDRPWWASMASEPW